MPLWILIFIRCLCHTEFPTAKPYCISLEEDDDVLKELLYEGTFICVLGKLEIF